MTVLPGAVPGAPARNGLPGPRPYQRGAPRPAWMIAAIAKAEAEHGKPRPTCMCGWLFTKFNGGYGHCLRCGWVTGGGA